MKTTVKETYCKYCGTKYNYNEEDESYLVRGDWCGHHPDHYDHYHKSYLEETPCPKCGHINKERITLNELEGMNINGMTSEQKYKYICSEKIIKNQQKTDKVKQKISESQDRIKEDGSRIKEILEKVNSNKKKMKENEQIIIELQNISNETYRNEQIANLNLENEKLNKKVISLFVERKAYLKIIEECRCGIRDLEDCIYRFEKENKILNQEINE